MTLVDDQGIDCVIRKSKNQYLDIQIKARSKNIVPKNAGYFLPLPIPQPRKNYFFIFYSEHIDTYWIIPSTKMVEEGFANQYKSGNNKGKYKIRLTNYSKVKDEISPRPKYLKYENAFEEVLGQPVP